jgi:putative tryptophan/tyrosine transport system substrate-binding protein
VTSGSRQLKVQKKIIATLSLCATLFALCGSAAAQQPGKIPQIGILANVAGPQIDALRQGLRDAGYVEGQSIIIEKRYADGNLDRLSELAAELVQLKVNLIVSIGPATPYAAKSIKNTPVVMGYSGDPVDAGIVASLARPGGNVTGMTFFAAELAGKRVELLKEAVPRISHLAVLANPRHAGEQRELKETQTVAQAMSLPLQYLTVKTPGDFAEAFDAMTRARADALITFPDALTLAQRSEIAAFAARRRLASVSGWSEFAEAGGLMTYGPNLLDSFKRIAVYVDKILKGAKPADLPVEQPKKLELVINLKTAKQIGLTVPPNVLARANRVIR